MQPRLGKNCRTLAMFVDSRFQRQGYWHLSCLYFNTLRLLALSGYPVFDYSLFGDLEAFPAPLNTDWDMLTLNPDLLLPDNGVYDAMALMDAASLLDPFTVSFVWLGSGRPGCQAFDIYDSSFQTIESGWTTSGATPVPESGTMTFVGVGLIGLAGWRKNREKG